MKGSSISLRRLEQNLPALREELNYLGTLSTADNECGDWQASSEALLKKIDEAVEQNDPDLGWSCFKAAARYNLCGMTEQTWRSRANTILHEAREKLGGWRLEAVLDLLAEEDRKQLKGKLFLSDVVRAAQILDDHFDNVYQKLNIINKQLKIVTVIMFCVLLVWIVIAPPVDVVPAELKLPGINSGERIFWIGVSLLGLMGALLSIFLSIRADSRQKRIPEVLEDNWFTAARLALAALTAIMATILLQSGIINLGESSGLTWMVALTAGFSERLVVRALGQVADSGAVGQDEEE